MHGVKKTPASEAQLAAFRKERNEKLQRFIAGKSLVFKKRKNKEYDEELLEVTGEILKKQPNIYTIWNIRREVLDVMKQKKDGETNDEHAERLTKLYDDELKLSQDALLSDPKSYSAWYHRDFILQEHPKPDFKAELELCEKALGFDCRNFHCWDHRRFVAKLANLDDFEELEFSDRLVGRNPSNYSAWHYRGTLLPKVRPNPNGNPAGIDDETMAEEFKKIQTAACVNTEDQTAWTYCRWLSEAACVGPVDPPTILTASFDNNKNMLLVFNKAVNRETVQSMVQEEINQFTPVSIYKSPHTHAHQTVKTWSVKLNKHEATIRVDNSDVTLVSATKSFVNSSYLEEYYSMKKMHVTETTRGILEELVDMCNELIKEEDDNPWEVVALARTLFLLNGPTKQNVDQVLAHLQTAATLDSQRKNVYKDMEDNVKVTYALQVETDSVSQLQKLLRMDEDQLDLPDIGIRNIQHLYPLAGLVKSLVLQRNSIENTKQFQPFQMLEYLTLDDNPVECLSADLRLPQLRFLSLARCPIERADALKNVLDIAPALDRLLICETPLANDKPQLARLQQHVRESGRNVRIIFEYL